MVMVVSPYKFVGDLSKKVADVSLPVEILVITTPGSLPPVRST